MSYLLGHTAALVLFAAVLWLPGYVLGELWLGRRGLGSLRPLAQICLGLCFWIATLFLIAAVGQLDRPAITVVTGGVLLAALWTWRTRRTGKRRRCRPPTRIAVLVGGGLAAILVPLYLLAISPTVSWDAGVYHLTVPKLWVEHGGFRPIPFNVYSNWPLNRAFIEEQGIFRYDFLRTVLDHRPSPRLRWHYFMIWQILGLKFWQEMFLERRDGREIENRVGGRG